VLVEAKVEIIINDITVYYYLRKIRKIYQKR